MLVDRSGAEGRDSSRGRELFFRSVKGCGAAHQIPGFALAGNRNPQGARARDRNVVPSQRTGNQNIPQRQQTRARKTPHRRGLKFLTGGECSRSYAFGRLPRFALFLRRSLRLRPRLLMVPPLNSDELGANLVTKYSVYRCCRSAVKSPEEILREAPAKP